MSCRPGMRGCAALCGHREMVRAYYAARDAALREAESLAHGGWAERDAEGVGSVAVTFKAWLIGNRTPEEWA